MVLQVTFTISSSSWVMSTDILQLVEVDPQKAWYESGDAYVKPPMTEEQEAAARALFAEGAF